MIEEFFVVNYYNGDYLVIDHECSNYDDCLKFMSEWAEQIVAERGKEEYNMIAEQDKHFCYWNIEKRFKLKGVK